MLFDREVLAAVGGSSVRWLDYPFDPSNPWLDGEWEGLNFLADSEDVRAAWRAVWPTTGKSQNWDAVAEIQVGSVREWLLVEAKGNLQEIGSSCHAKDAGGRPLITRTMAETKADLGVPDDRDWMNGYYQVCNRLVVLNFLRKRGIGARLLFVYFTGDRSGPRRTCPKSSAEWDAALSVQDKHVGLPTQHPLSDRIHKMFLDVIPRAAAAASVTFTP
jgi:hypothetical protein